MSKIYLFNPQHDLSLAAGDIEFRAPESAVQLASDLSLLPVWYADMGDTVISDTHSPLSPLVSGVTIADINRLETEENDRFIPWGWDRSVHTQLLRAGIQAAMLPSLDEIDDIRALSHRRTAAIAMEHVKTNAPSMKWPDTAVELKSFREVEKFTASHTGQVVLKAPWSCSGRGIFWTGHNITQSLAGWCARIIQRQGCVMGEPALDKTQDFAMEFLCSGGKTSFAGYSLFTTTGGVYRGNRMMNNSMIETALSAYVPLHDIHTVRDLLLAFIAAHIAPRYNGYIGVDMLIYRDGNTHFINPAVEINLRMTMGMVARCIYDRHIAPGRSGWFHIDHQPPGVLPALDREMHGRMPLEIENGKILRGYTPLVPVSDSSVYTAYLIIE